MTPLERIAKQGLERKAKSPNLPKFKFKGKAMREALNVSASRAAYAIGMTPQTYFVIENGGGPTLANAFKIAAFYGKRIDELWEAIES